MSAVLKPQDDVAAWDNLPAQLSWKEKIAYLGVQFMKLPQSECSVTHVLGHRMYVRKMTIPKGTVFLGRAHRYGHECSLLSGSIVLITPDSKRVMHACKTIHTTPGYHMVFYALTDVEGQTVHPNPRNLTDVQVLEDDIFESAESLHLLGQQIERRLT